MLMVVCLSEKVVDTVLFCFVLNIFVVSLYFISNMYFFDIQEKQGD